MLPGQDAVERDNSSRVVDCDRDRGPEESVGAACEKVNCQYDLISAALQSAVFTFRISMRSVGKNRRDQDCDVEHGLIHTLEYVLKCKRVIGNTRVNRNPAGPRRRQDRSGLLGAISGLLKLNKNGNLCLVRLLIAHDPVDSGTRLVSPICRIC